MEKYMQHLAFLEEQTTEITNHLNSQDLERVPYAITELLYRVKSAAKGLGRLFEGVEEDPDLEFSAALVMRTMLLDFFVSLRCQDIKERGLSDGKIEADVNTDLTEYINSVLGDGIKRTGDLFRQMADAKHITEAELASVLSNLSKNYSSFIELYDGKRQLKAKYPDAPGAIALFRKISENPRFHPLARRIETYALYSKYEHFNIMSYDTMRRGKTEQASTLSNGIELLILHSYNCISILNHFLKSDFTKDKLALLAAYIAKRVFEMTDAEAKEQLGGD